MGNNNQCDEEFEDDEVCNTRGRPCEEVIKHDDVQAVVHAPGDELALRIQEFKHWWFTIHANGTYEEPAEDAARVPPDKPHSLGGFVHR